MTAFFKDNPRDVEYVLRIILGKDDLNVEKVTVQEPLKNLRGRSVILDVKATDDEKREYDFEIQRSDAGSGFKRARHNLAMLDSSILEPGKSPEELPECYVIFITENDVIGMDKSIYYIDRYIKWDTSDEAIPANDGAHIIYVNGSRRSSQSELEKLMHDFFCTNAQDLYHQKLAEKMSYLKNDMKGEKVVSRIVEEIVEEEKKEMAMEIAGKMIVDGIDINKVAKYLSLPLEEIESLAESLMAQV